MINPIHSFLSIENFYFFIIKIYIYIYIYLAVPDLSCNTQDL